MVVPAPATPNRYAFETIDPGVSRRGITVQGEFVTLGPLTDLLAQPALVDTVGREPGSMRPEDGERPDPGPIGARALLWVERFVPLIDGFAVRFNHALEIGGLEVALDDAGRGSAKTPDIVVNGSDGRPVAGTITLDADGRGFRFVVAGGEHFEPGVYEVLLRSGADAFHGFFGALDGDRNGQAGDGYRTRFEVPVGSAQANGQVSDAGDEAVDAAAAPQIVFGESYAGFALSGVLAFGMAARRESRRDARRWQRELLLDGSTKPENPNRTLTIRLDS